MRLLDTTTLQLKTFEGGEKPDYAILSHTWGDDEVLFEDLQSKSVEQWKNKAGAGKILNSIEICARHKISYIWIDTCCIDKRSSSELSEAINSMFKWYLSSRVCYAYLSDVLLSNVQDPQNGIVQFEESRWFRRGWTLQELIAPTTVQLFDKEWRYMGRRSKFAERIHSITGIDKYVLRCSDTHSRVTAIMARSVHTKMVWASHRTTTRAEDRAYSLMGLFDVNMPLLYGEGGVKAFQRLQDEIVKGTNDQSILLHSSGVYSNHLARSPNDFTSLHQFRRRESHDLTFQKTRDGIDVSLGLFPAHGRASFWGIVTAYFSDDPSELDQPALKLGSYGTGGPYRREDGIIYRIRLGDEGQMEVFDETGKKIEVLRYYRPRREVVRLTFRDTFQIQMANQKSHIRILLRPIVHESVSVEYHYHLLCPQSHGAVISAKPPYTLLDPPCELNLTAWVLLQNLGLNPGSSNVAILVFRYTWIYLHLVDVEIWLREKITEFETHTLDSVAARLSTLPIVTEKYKNPSTTQVRYAIQNLESKYDQNAGASIVMSNGVRVRAWIREQMFFEDIVYHLHVKVHQQ
ncbi:HET-domain-containing protein [Xylaria scruposa]|nr:HET-domain-containing protein [Xylaria scruposa]